MEFKDGKMSVLRGEPAITNFYLTGGHKASACPRYSTIAKALKDSSGVLAKADMFKVLEDVHQPSTQWSVVYDLNAGTAELATDARFNNTHKFRLR